MLGQEGREKTSLEVKECDLQIDQQALLDRSDLIVAADLCNGGGSEFLTFTDEE